MIYFELKYAVILREQLLLPGVYSIDGEAADLSNIIPWKLMSQAEKVWEETEKGPRYLKDRNVYGGTEERQYAVDLKEFTWAKLRAKPYMF